MLDFTTTDWEFDLDGSAKEIQVSNKEVLPFLAKPGAWEQYTDDRVYEADKLMREWISAMKQNSAWTRSKNMRRYTFSMIFEQLYGRKYTQATDAKMINALSRVIAYYSTRIQTGGNLRGKHYTKTIYTVSPKGLQRPEYSLKLRLERFREEGIIPSNSNMQLPKDNLKPGHARNKKTEANMEARREIARKRYNERYHDRNH